MVQKLLLVTMCVCLVGALICSGEEENLSGGRTLGVGMQVDFPWGGLVSGRYWFSPSLGAEGVVFMWGNAEDFSGSLTGRLLYRVSDTPAADFYLAFGASYPFSRYGENDAILSLAGGIEFGFVAARSLAWNVEFGVSTSVAGEINMVFGTGIHFYFQ
jgi:hypothetical protein